MAEFKPVKIHSDDEKNMTPGAMNVNAETGDITFVWSDGEVTNRGTSTGEKGDPGDPGLPGAKGDPGDPGEPGATPTFEGGTATSVESDQPFSFDVVETPTGSHNYRINITMPKGEKGENAVAAINPRGEYSDDEFYTKGDYVTAANGNAYVLMVPQSQGVEPSSNPAMWQLIALKGAKGEPGVQGQDGEGATIAIGTVTTLEAGQEATVTNSGTATNAVFDIALPRGMNGADGSTTVFQGEPMWRQWFDATNGIPSAELNFKDASSISTRTAPVINVKHVNGKFYAVCSRRTSVSNVVSYILESTDGDVWEPVVTKNLYLQDILFVDGNFYVTAGDSGTNTTSNASTSGGLLKGVSLNNISLVDSNSFITCACVAHGNGKILYGGVFSLNGSRVNAVLRYYDTASSSIRGISDVPSVQNSAGVTNIAFGNNRFVVTFAIGKIVVLDANDMSIIKTVTSPFTTRYYKALVFNGTSFVYKIQNNIWTSEDGELWNNISNQAPNPNNSTLWLHYVDNYYATGSSSNGIYISQNAVDWGEVIPIQNILAMCAANGVLVAAGGAFANSTGDIVIKSAGTPEFVTMSHRMIDKKADLDFNTLPVGSIVYVADEKKQYVKGANGAEYEFGGAGGGEVAEATTTDLGVVKYADAQQLESVSGNGVITASMLDEILKKKYG